MFGWEVLTVDSYQRTEPIMCKSRTTKDQILPANVVQHTHAKVPTGAGTSFLASSPLEQAI